MRRNDQSQRIEIDDSLVPRMTSGLERSQAPQQAPPPNRTRSASSAFDILALLTSVEGGGSTSSRRGCGILAVMISAFDGASERDTERNRAEGVARGRKSIHRAVLAMEQTVLARRFKT